MTLRARKNTMMLAIMTTVALSVTGCETTTETTNSPVVESVPSPTGPGDLLPTTPAPDVADKDSESEARAVAEAATDAWLSDPRDKEAWWERVSTFLSNDAWRAFSTVNPEYITPAIRTGNGVLAQGGTGSSLTVLVPTTDGEYTVRLLRAGDDGTKGSWRVSDIGTSRSSR